MTRLVHASCAVRDEFGVLIRGRPGSGKSDLLLRLLGRGFDLVADDCVLLDGAIARAPERLQGLLEVRGLGVYRRSYREYARIALVVEAGHPPDRIATNNICPDTLAPVITLDLLSASSTDKVDVALCCLAGVIHEIAGPLLSGIEPGLDCA